MSRGHLHIFAVLLWLAIPLSVNADALFSYGFSPRTIGMGNAFTAIADDVSSSFYNPGATIQAEHIQAGVGYLYSFSGLSTKYAHHKAELDSTHGIIVGVNLPIPFGAWLKNRIWFGFTGFFPDGVLLSIKVPLPTEPQYLLLQNSGRSVSLVPTLSVRIIDGLGIGGGAQLFDNTRGEINAEVDASGEIVTTVGQELPTSFAPVAGIFFAPGMIWKNAGGIRFGLTYRQRFFTFYEIPVNTYLGGIPLQVGFKATSLYTPDQYVFGTAYFLDDYLRLSFDLAYNRWSLFPDPNLQIDVEMEIPLLPIQFQDSLKFEPDFSDTITIRTGAEWKAIDHPVMDLLVRAGYFYDPTPVPGQTGMTNYLDTDRHVVSVCPGILVKRIGSLDLSKLPLSIDLAFQYQHMVERIHYKNDSVAISNPGYPKIGIGGSLYSISLMIGTQFDVE